MKSFADQLSWIETHFREILPSTEVTLDLKYATAENFMQQDLYHGFHRAFLHPLAFAKFEKACLLLKDQHADLQFVIWDSLRPQSVQFLMYEQLKGSAQEQYIAKPTPGSLHNRGLALDLTLKQKDGEYLQMGTGFDDFDELAQPMLESDFRKSGRLTETAFENRMILRSLMESSGFKVLDHEWWHFNALPRDQINDQSHPLLE